MARAWLHGFEEIKADRQGLAGPSVDDTKVTAKQNGEWTMGRFAFGSGGKIYRYVNHVDGVNSIVGGVARLNRAEEPYEVTMDNSSDLASLPAGIYVSVMTQDTFGWILVSGIATDVLKVAAAGGEVIAAGDMVATSTADAEDGMCEDLDVYSNLVFGDALDAAASAATRIERVRLRGLI